MTRQEKKILARVVEIQKENWGNHTFFRHYLELKKLHIIMSFDGFFLNNLLIACCLIISEKCVVTPNFLFGFQKPLLTLFDIVIDCKKYTSV